MKVFKVLVASLVVLGLASSVAMAGANCGSAKKAGASCGSASAQTIQASAGSSCGAAAQQASAGGACGSQAVQASAGSCGTMMKAGLCSPSDCAPGSCPTGEKGSCASSVMYRVMVDGAPKVTFDRAKATTWADGGAIEYVAAGKTYGTEAEAKQAMTKVIYANLDKLMTVSYMVGDESMQCAQTASKMCESSGKKMMFRVAAHDFESREAADAFLVKAQAAVEGLKLVDGAGCSVEACAVSHAKDNPSCASKGFKVGNVEISDPVDANLTLAQQRLQAVLGLEA